MLRKQVIWDKLIKNRKMIRVLIINFNNCQKLNGNLIVLPPLKRLD